MSERYTKLYSLPENLYVDGAPIIIVAGALLKDKATNKVLAQLKMKNITSNSIKAVKIKLAPLDTAGKPLGDETEYQYLDLSVARDTEFGQKVAIPLSNDITRSFLVTVDEVIFTDNSSWLSTDDQWESLAAPVTLDTALGDPELVKQYKLKYGADCQYMPKEDKALWHCSCGVLNHNEETSCRSCRKELATLKAFNIDTLKTERDARLAAEKEQADKDKLAAEIKAKAAEIKAKKVKKLLAITIPIVVIAIAAAIFVPESIRKNTAYKDAVSLSETGQFDEAIVAFEALGSYKDAEARIEDVEREKENARREEGARLLAEGDYDGAAEIFTELGDMSPIKSALKEIRDKNASVQSIISAGWAHTVGLRADGTAVAAGYNGDGRCDVSEWKDVVAVSTADTSSFGLKADGTVVQVGKATPDEKLEVSKWKDIVAISATPYGAVGLKADGTVVGYGTYDANDSVSNWKDIISVAMTGESGALGLKKDGTIVSSRDDGQAIERDGQDIVAVSAGYYHIIALKADGTVNGWETDEYDALEALNWKNVVAVSAGGYHVAGLRADGTVVAIGDNGLGQCDVSDWENIVAISAGGYCTVGLKSDGTVVAAGDNGYGQCDVSDWKLW